MLAPINMVINASHTLFLSEQVKTNHLKAAGRSVPRPEESSSSRSVLVFWLVTAQEHVVMQRPMRSPEQAISTVRLAAVLAPERISAAVPLQRETP